jgi:hypothetical protein
VNKLFATPAASTVKSTAAGSAKPRRTRARKPKPA